MAHPVSWPGAGACSFLLPSEGVWVEGGPGTAPGVWSGDSLALAGISEGPDALAILVL